MDTIEFKGMDAQIETVPHAAVSPTPSAEIRQDHFPQQSSSPQEHGHVHFCNCEDAKVHAMPDTFMANTGRVLDVTMTLRHICPCRRVAVGVLVSEVDQAGNEHSRGFKAVTVPAHYNPNCCDVEMPRARFILPDDLCSDGGADMGDGCRHFIVRTEAHYVDTGVAMP